MRQLTLVLCFLGFVNSLSAQDAPNFWSPLAADNINLPENGTATLKPSAFQTYKLNYDEMCQALAQAPMEFTDAAKNRAILVNLPLADGTVQTFELCESPIMAPELSAKYPAIRNYAGTATDGSGTCVRLGVGYQGFHAFLFEKDGTIQSVRPYAQGQNSYYMAYRLADLPKEVALQDGIRCGADNHEGLVEHFEQEIKNSTVTDRGSALVNLKTYRIAIAAQGEYSVFHGGTKPLVLAAINTALDFIVAIKERDFAVRLELIPNNDEIIFLDPDTDPYSGTLVSLWMNQNPAAIDSIIPNNSYDIGHVFSRFVTGNQVGIVSGRTCDDATKARGASSASQPNAEYFFLVAAHEFCHQLNGGHTWSNCPGSEPQIAPETAFEPASGTTIMSYAGSCSGGNNVQDENDPYFHIGTIVQVQDFIWNGGGNTCGTTTQTTNNAPEVSIVSPNNIVIPIGTPFRLTASGSDIDGDDLTYCWEQYDTDLGLYQLGSPENNAPAFRSFIPTDNPTRYFPNLIDYAANVATPAEVLPSYDRTMTFRVTVRDNHANGGGQAWDEMKISPRTTAGPFRVTYPNVTNINWVPETYETVTWDVANTDNQNLVNCQLVNIKMSTNSGQTFPITLATNVPNRGRYCIQVPNVTTGGGRIMVEAADNVFFDISNNNISIQPASSGGYSLCSAAMFDTICLPLQYSTVISTTSEMGFSDPITLTVEGLPMGVTASITPNPVMPGNDAVLVLDFPMGQQEAILDYTLKADAGGVLNSTDNTLWVFQNDLSGLSLAAPADGADGQSRAPALRWNTVSGVKTVEVEVATNPSFDAGLIVTAKDGITADSFVVPIQLDEGAVYYWRFRAKNECGIGKWVGPFAFATLLDVCASFEALDLPLNITSSAVVTVESVINVPINGSISDVNITSIQGFHTFFKDLEMHLISPAGTDVLLFEGKCGSYNGNFSFGFDDTSPSAFACPPSNGTSYMPVEPLSAFDGQNANGDWTLRVKDNVISSGGGVQAFNLELCSSTALNPPMLINNNALQVAPGSNGLIATDLLKTEDSNNSDAELVYTLMTVPQHGHLELNWTGALQAGVQFTQADLNNNALRYFDYGGIAGSDEFCFTVTDGEGGLVKDCFAIQQFPLSDKEANQALRFQLAPNPASTSVRLTFGETLRSDTRIRVFDSAGRLLQSNVLGSGAVLTSLDVTNWAEGFYTIAVDNAEGSGVQRLIVR